MAKMNYIALKAELQDPKYAALSHQEAADLLNGETVEVDRVATGAECAAATDAGEFNALSTEDKKSQWLSMCGWDEVDFNNGVAKAAAQGIWSGAAGTKTRPALIALSKTNVAPRSQLDLGYSGKISDDHVRYARENT